jgi:hypothetical protein
MLTNLPATVTRPKAGLEGKSTARRVPPGNSSVPKDPHSRTLHESDEKSVQDSKASQGKFMKIVMHNAKKCILHPITILILLDEDQ